MVLRVSGLKDTMTVQALDVDKLVESISVQVRNNILAMKLNTHFITRKSSRLFQENMCPSLYALEKQHPC